MNVQTLTLFKNKPYNPLTANALAVGFDDLNGQNNGALAPCNSLGVFLCLKGFPLVVCGGELSSSPVIAVGVHRFVNPSHAATIIFDEMWCQLVLDQTQDTNMTKKVTAFMPEDCYAFDPKVDTTKLYDPIYISLQRAASLIELLQDNGQDLTEGFTVPHNTVMSLLGSLETDITSAKKLMETWQISQAGEAH